MNGTNRLKDCIAQLDAEAPAKRSFRSPANPFRERPAPFELKPGGSPGLLAGQSGRYIELTDPGAIQLSSPSDAGVSYNLVTGKPEILPSTPITEWKASGGTGGWLGFELIMWFLVMCGVTWQMFVGISHFEVQRRSEVVMQQMQEEVLTYYELTGRYPSTFEELESAGVGFAPPDIEDILKGFTVQLPDGKTIVLHHYVPQ